MVLSLKEYIDQFYNGKPSALAKEAGLFCTAVTREVDAGAVINTETGVITRTVISTRQCKEWRK